MTLSARKSSGATGGSLESRCSNTTGYRLYAKRRRKLPLFAKLSQPMKGVEVREHPPLELRRDVGAYYVPCRYNRHLLRASLLGNFLDQITTEPAKITPPKISPRHGRLEGDTDSPGRPLAKPCFLIRPPACTGCTLSDALDGSVRDVTIIR